MSSNQGRIPVRLSAFFLSNQLEILVKQQSSKFAYLYDPAHCIYFKPVENPVQPIDEDRLFPVPFRNEVFFILPAIQYRRGKLPNQ